MILPTPEAFRRKCQPDTRLLGMDVGTKTIGLALSDALCMIASPLETIRRKRFSEDATYLRELAREYRIGGLVIGYPLNMDGTSGPRCQSIRQFAVNLEPHLSMPMLLWDERLSSVAVERAMLEGDLSRAKRAKQVDKLAAAYILQGCLDAMTRLTPE